MKVRGGRVGCSIPMEVSLWFKLLSCLNFEA